MSEPEDTKQPHQPPVLLLPFPPHPSSPDPDPSGRETNNITAEVPANQADKGKKSENPREREGGLKLNLIRRTTNKTKRTNPSSSSPSHPSAGPGRGGGEG